MTADRVAPRVLLNVQILRALAATLVVAGHVGQELERLSGAAAYMGWFNWGWGVPIFFVISGFIMVYTSAGDFGRPAAARDFMARRLIRIVPLYWFMTTLVILGTLAAPGLLNVPLGDWRHVLASYLFIPEMRPNGEVRPTLALGWTLNFEMLFYVAFAAAMLAPLRKGLAALAAAFCALALFGAFGPWGVTQIDFWAHELLLVFLFGVGVGLLALRGVRLTALQAGALAAAGVSLAFLMGPYWIAEERVPEAVRAGVPAALLIAAGALGPDLRATRATRALAFLGEASYALYLIHPFVIRPLRVVWAQALGTAAAWVYVPVAIAAAIVAALVLHVAFERPVTRWLTGLRRRARGAPRAFPARAPEPGL